MCQLPVGAKLRRFELRRETPRAGLNVNRHFVELATNPRTKLGRKPVFTLYDQKAARPPSRCSVSRPHNWYPRFRRNPTRGPTNQAEAKCLGFFRSIPTNRNGLRP